MDLAEAVAVLVTGLFARLWQTVLYRKSRADKRA